MDITQEIVTYLEFQNPENLMEKKTTLCDGSFLCKDYFIISSSSIIMHLLLGRN